ncbi:MAG: efflux RND transporter permease subunit [Verrucomicrobiales bacterium]
MIDALIRWSLRNKGGVLLLSMLVTVLGLFTAARMPVDVFPDLTAPTVTVITEAHGMAPAEVETQVTFPIESSLNGAAGVRRVRSSTAVGISVIWVEFDWGTDIQSARQIVTEKVALAANDLPPEIDPPILAPTSSIMGEVLFIALTSDRHTPTELRTVAETVLRRRLLSVAGVSQVTPIGGDVKQYQVIVEPGKLVTFEVGLQEVIDALKLENSNVSAGFINERGSEILVTGRGRYRDLQSIEKTLVSLKKDRPVTVGDLGTVTIGKAQKRGEGSANGKQAVLLGIQKQPQANTLELTQTLDEVLNDIQSKLPQGMQVDKRIFRQADFISVAVQNVIHALRDGAILVVIIVLLFLANIRATLITVIAIPLSLLTTVLILKAFGATINTMTLGGMAIAIGALVDDAVIDVENVFRRLRENHRLPEASRRPALQVVYEASVEIRSSILFATLIIVLVFAPLFFLSGVEGRLLQPLGIAYVTALIASLIVAVTITPALCLLLLPGSKAVKEAKEPRVVEALKRIYGPVLSSALKHPWIITSIVCVLFLIALAYVPFLGRSFLPEFNEGSLTISAVSMPGISLEQSDKLGRAVEQTLMSLPEVVSVARRTGRAELDEHAQGVEAAELDVSLQAGKRSKEEFLQELRDQLSTIPGMNITIGQPISHRIDHMLSGTRANLAVKIFGDHLPTLRTMAEEVRQAMSTVQGVVDLSVEQQTEIPNLLVTYDRDAMARYGLSAAQVANHLEAAVQGFTVSRILEGRQSFDLVVKMEDGDSSEITRLENLLVSSPSGARVPLSQVAMIKRETTPNVINREQIERKIVVMCNVAGRDIASVVADVQSVTEPILAKRTGYRVEYGGQFESANEARLRLTILSLVAFAGIFFLLRVAFDSTKDAALVLLNLPLALIGGLAGVFLTGGVLSVASIIGFITVFGIATRNGIMLVSHIRHLQQHEGVYDFYQAVRQGSLERLAPILMTALATALALIPLALGGDKPGNEIQTPMAIVILFGLLTSMLMNMILVPALYLRFGAPAKINLSPKV